MGNCRGCRFPGQFRAGNHHSLLLQSCLATKSVHTFVSASGAQVPSKWKCFWYRAAPLVATSNGQNGKCGTSTRAGDLENNTQQNTSTSASADVNTLELPTNCNGASLTRPTDALQASTDAQQTSSNAKDTTLAISHDREVTNMQSQTETSILVVTEQRAQAQTGAPNDDQAASSRANPDCPLPNDIDNNNNNNNNNNNATVFGDATGAANRRTKKRRTANRHRCQAADTARAVNVNRAPTRNMPMPTTTTSSDSTQSTSPTPSSSDDEQSPRRQQLPERSASRDATPTIAATSNGQLGSPVRFLSGNNDPDLGGAPVVHNGIDSSVPTSSSLASHAIQPTDGRSVALQTAQLPQVIEQRAPATSGTQENNGLQLALAQTSTYNANPIYGARRRGRKREPTMELARLIRPTLARNYEERSEADQDYDDESDNGDDPIDDDGHVESGADVGNGIYDQHASRLSRTE